MPDNVTIVAGGWSVKHIDANRLPGTVIGVNDSGVLLPRCDIALSMDRLWTENRASILRTRKIRSYIRRSAMKNVEPWPELTVFECDNNSTEMSDDPAVLNGTNSGLCAINLAYQMKPARVFLCGFDMSRGPYGEPYWYDNYSWARPGGATTSGKYAEWARQFEAVAKAFGAAGIAIYNVSPSKAISALPRIEPSEMAELA